MSEFRPGMQEYVGAAYPAPFAPNGERLAPDDSQLRADEARHDIEAATGGREVSDVEPAPRDTIEHFGATVVQLRFNKVAEDTDSGLPRAA